MGDLSDRPTAAAGDDSDEVKVEDLEAPESDTDKVVGGETTANIGSTSTGAGAGKVGF